MSQDYSRAQRATKLLMDSARRTEREQGWHKTRSRRLLPFLRERLQEADLALDTAGIVSGLESTWLQAIFERYCKRDDRRNELCQSQRYAIKRRLEAIVRGWEGEGLIEPAVLQLRNYPRADPLQLFNPARVRQGQPGRLQRVIGRFLYELVTVEARDDAERYFRCVTAMRLMGGVAWRGSVDALLDLRGCHLMNAVYGQVPVPRRWGRGDELRADWPCVYLGPAVQVCALSVLMNASRSSSGRGRRQVNLHRISPEGVLAPPGATKRDWRAWWVGLNERAGFKRPIPARELPELIYWRLAKHHDNVVLAAMRGKVRWSPVPPDQRDIFASYRELLRWRSPRGRTRHPDLVTAQPEIAPQVNRTVATEHHRDEQGDTTTEVCERLRNLNPARNDSVSRELLAEQAEQWARRKLASLCGGGVEGLDLLLSAYRVCSSSTALSASSVDDVTLFNGALVALYLAHRLRLRPSLSVATIHADVDDCIELIKWSPDECLNDLGESDERDDLEVYVADHSDLEPKTIKRRVSTWRSLRGFARQRGLPLVKVDWEISQALHRYDPVRLVSWQEIGEILRELGISGSQLARQAVMSVLLMVYFGLRLGEVIRLRVGDAVLVGPPHLWVVRSKNKTRRWVYAHHVPDADIDYLREYRDERMAAGATPDRPLLAGIGDGGAVQSSIARLITQAMDACGLREENLPGLRVTPHRLRHVYANRRFVLGDDVRDIMVSMGHKSPTTTCRSYIHAFDWMMVHGCWPLLVESKDPLVDPLEYACEATLPGVAADLLGITPRQLRNLVHEFNQNHPNDPLPMPGVGLSLLDLARLMRSVMEGSGWVAD